ncbi:MOSC domain-containing protein [Telluria sp. B2]
MRVSSISHRPAHAQLLLPADAVDLFAGLGIRGDRHADPLSARQLLLVSTAVYEDLALPALALRENLAIGADTAHLASGTVLRIGDEVQLRIMFQCEACGQLDALHPGLAKRIGKRRGVLARVLAGGRIARGDSVHDLGVLFPAWSDDWRERVRRVLDAVPAGATIEYRQLARLAGIQSSYCRAFPRLIRQLGDNHAGKAVSSQSAHTLPRWEGQGLFDHS